MESGYEHRGSCHCRSIQFLVSYFQMAVAYLVSRVVVGLNLAALILIFDCN